MLHAVTCATKAAKRAGAFQRASDTTYRQRFGQSCSRPFAAFLGSEATSVGSSLDGD